MELVIGAVVAGFLFALFLAFLIWKVVSRAVDNGVDWLIQTFGNERASREVEERRARADKTE